ncbi:hypothetical protein RJ639_015269 [Escallonia herrerae]|uniref:CCHC-type domain-containing protein n=1 Tax=Escallonia herrerae TaxID=1293975 RepID=A0AA89AN81_9ASTE|nr:hypothetical protein RJ639_015269 [Escallonia herrerae]
MWRKAIGDGISSSIALSVESRGRQNNRGRSPTRGRSKSRGKSKSKGRTIVCWNCNKEGHKKNDCTEPKKKKGAGGRQDDDERANMIDYEIKVEGLSFSAEDSGGAVAIGARRLVPSRCRERRSSVDLTLVDGW